MSELTDMQRFKIARIKFDQSTQDVADHFGYSARYIYEVLKYPNKNPELFKQIQEYISSSEGNVKTKTA